MEEMDRAPGGPGAAWGAAEGDPARRSNRD